MSLFAISFFEFKEKRDDNYDLLTNCFAEVIFISSCEGCYVNNLLKFGLNYKFCNN